MLSACTIHNSRFTATNSQTPLRTGLELIAGGKWRATGVKGKERHKIFGLTRTVGPFGVCCGGRHNNRSAHYLSLCALHSKPQNKLIHFTSKKQSTKGSGECFKSKRFSFIVCGTVISENGHERGFKMQNHTIAALSLRSVINEEGMSVSLLRMLVGSLFLSFSHRISQDVFLSFDCQPRPQ